MEYRIRKEYHQEEEDVKHIFRIQIRYKILFWKYWAYLYANIQGSEFIKDFNTQKEAEDYVSYLCRKKKVVVPPTEIIKKLNCNER